MNHSQTLQDLLNDHWFIVVKHSGKCLTVEKMSLKNSANVVQSENVNKDNQKWRFEHTGDGKTFYIIARHSGKGLDVRNHSLHNGANVFQHELFKQMDKNNENQKWRLVHAGAGWWYIIANHSGKGLDVKDHSLKDGATVFQHKLFIGEKTNDNQKFKFEKAEEVEDNGVKTMCVNCMEKKLLKVLDCEHVCVCDNCADNTISE